MTGSILFEAGQRKSIDPKDLGETYFDYINRSARPEIAAVRSIMNSWFSLRPDELKDEFLSRLKAENNFNGAFFESFLFGLFTKLGFSIELDPKTGVNSKIPDFLLCNGQHQIIVEATSNEYSLESRIPNFKIRKQIVEELNDLNLGPIRLLILDLKVLAAQKPSVRELKRKLVNHCKAIGLLGYADNTFLISDDQRFTYSNSDIFFCASFFVSKEDVEHKRKNVLIDSYDLVIDETTIQLIRSIAKKKSKYGNLSKPYLICVNFPRVNLAEEDVLSCLTRSEICSSAKSQQSVVFDRSPTSKLISALFISSIVPENITHPQYWFIKNPYAEFPISHSQIPLDAFEYINNEWIFHQLN